jgi:hypothetical protein
MGSAAGDLLATKTFVTADRDDDELVGINSPAPRGPELDSNLPDLEVVVVELEDDAVIVVGLRVADPAQIEGH